jgi:hypothetical protein
MAKPQKDETELHPDAWQRFERAFTAVAKSPPQHRKSVGKAQTKKKKIVSKRKLTAG